MRVVHIYGMRLMLAICMSFLSFARVEANDEVYRTFALDVIVFSMVPGDGLDSYEFHGLGSGTGHATMGFSMTVDDVRVSPRIVARSKKGRFLATVDIEPEQAKRSLDFESKELDLTDLTPTTVRLAKATDGRVYQLTLTPRVLVIDNTPRDLDASNLRLHCWSFRNSRVMVDDAIYVGQLSFSGGNVAYVDISGVARVEFSHYQVTDSKPWGVLHQGIITITNPDDETTIQINRVRNGIFSSALPGGPYRIWVRWSDPTKTAEEHHNELIAMRERVLEQAGPNASTVYLDKQLARGPTPWIESSGMRVLKPGERVESDDEP